MNPLDYIYFSLLKRQLTKKTSKQDDSSDAKAGFLNGILYTLLFYNIVKLFKIEFTPVFIIVGTIIGLVPLTIYGFTSRMKLFSKYRSKANGGNLIVLVIWILAITTIFLWNMDIFNQAILGDDLN